MHDDMTPPHALTTNELYAAIEEDASRSLADAARIDPIETALDLEYYAGGLPDTDRAIAENLRAYAVELRRRSARAEDARIRDLLLFADQTTQARDGALSAHHVHVDGYRSTLITEHAKTHCMMSIMR
jgi:hypothetical protein